MNKIAVMVPCYNEELTVKKVIDDFHLALPDADIYVYDNNSTDKTAEIARKSEAIVRKERRQGKGFVVQSMFQDIDADIYVITDGDDTYPASEVQKLISEIKNGSDVAVGDRLSNGSYGQENKRDLHEFGNRFVKFLINRMFNVHLHDIMSGYRAFSSDFVKNYPAVCDGFQVETDMTIFALDRNFIITEVDINFQDRPSGSESKLNTYSDGLKVVVTIFNLYRHYKPLAFFGILAIIFLGVSLLVGAPVIAEYLSFNYIHKLPSAVLSASLAILSFLFLITGFILDSICHANREIFYLQKK